MTDHASHTVAAKVDIYPQDPAKQGQGRAADRVTFVLENVTAVQMASSKTHPLAFEIVEAVPVLVLSGQSETESSGWITALRHIFFIDGHEADKSEHFAVTVVTDADSQRLGLRGTYFLRIAAEGVALLRSRPHAVSDTLAMSPPTATPQQLVHVRCKSEGAEGSERVEEEVVMTWKLPMLKRFNVEKGLFVLDCGPNSPKGEATIRFISDDANVILTSMRRYISVALAARKRMPPKATSDGPRSRTDSVMTVTGYQGLLDRSEKVSESAIPETAEGPEDSGNGNRKDLTIKLRSESQSSTASTVKPTSPTSSFGDVAMTTSVDNLSSDLEMEMPTVRPKQRVSVHSLGGARQLSSSPNPSLTGSSRQLSSSPGSRVSEALENTLGSSGKVLDPSCGTTFGSPIKTPDFFGDPSLASKASDAYGSEFQLQQEILMQKWQQMLMWQQQQQHMQTNSPLLQRQQEQQQQQLRSQLPASAPFLEPHQFALWLQAHQQLGVPLNEYQQPHWWMLPQHLYMQQAAGEQPRGTGNLVRNSSVPYDMIDQTIAGGAEGAMRIRTSSLTVARPHASESICSGDSGVVVTERTRRGSNSFDSAVSTESSISVRRTSDVVEPILESPAAEKPGPLPVTGLHEGPDLSFLLPPSEPSVGSNKSTPSGSSAHIYQDLESLRNDGTKLYRRHSSEQDGLGMGRRSHSAGDVRKENDYDEIKKVAPAVSSVFLDTPPELPARPASLQQQAKVKTIGHRSLFSSALSILTGAKTIKDSKARPSSLEKLALTDELSRSPITLSSASSLDLYSTIGDDEYRQQIRPRSNNVTFTPSNPDLLTSEKSSGSPGPAPRVPIRQKTDPNPNASAGLGPNHSSAPVNLLTFSDNDVSQLGGARPKLIDKSGGLQLPCDAVLDSKAALLDFFLNDTTFHANPMVTGQLKVTGPSDSQLRASDPNLHRTMPATLRASAAGDGFVSPGKAATTAEWARFSDQPSCSQTGTPPLGTGLTARVEGVYIDMRKRGEDCEYVAPSEVNSERDRDFLEFLFLQ